MSCGAADAIVCRQIADCVVIAFYMHKPLIFHDIVVFLQIFIHALKITK